MLALNWPMAGVQQGLCGMLHGMLTVLSGEAKPYEHVRVAPPRYLYFIQPLDNTISAWLIETRKFEISVPLILA